MTIGYVKPGTTRVDSRSRGSMALQAHRLRSTILCLLEAWAASVILRNFGADHPELVRKVPSTSEFSQSTPHFGATLRPAVA
jgi:hypothetical protein